MRLNKLTVEGFKSFKKPQNLIVDERVTIFIGANDHGKTNLLEAIRRLNDDAPITNEDKNYDLSDSSHCRVNWYFKLTKDEIENIKELQAIPSETPAVEENQTPGEETTVAEEIPSNDQKEIIYMREENEAVKVSSVPLQHIPITNNQSILSLRPKVELFKIAGNNLVDSVNRQELDGNECMQGIFRLAGLWDERDRIFTISTETSRVLDEATDTLTKALNSQWNQGKNLEWKIKHVGNNGDRIELNIKDPAIDRIYSKPSLRSAGFQTFFLLSMIISARTANANSGSYIFLFDEPATELHPKAQLDLQRSFEFIAENAQLMYATHSLFLINKNYPQRNCVVKKTGDGSLIDHKPFINNWKSVRESLGILMSNNFLIADKTLLVEGPSDIIYILAAVKHMKLNEKIDIDLNDFSIVDAGSEENYIAMAKLMLAEGRYIVALLDGDDHGNNVENELKKVCEKEIIDRTLKIHKLPKNKSIEDVMPDHGILQNATLNFVKYLEKNNILVKKEGVIFEDEIKKISPSGGKTLGKILEEVTQGLWNPEKKISKLNIAMFYEDICNPPDNEEKPTTVTLEIKLPEECEKELKEIKKKLNLKGERAKFGGVFQEIN